METLKFLFLAHQIFLETIFSYFKLRRLGTGPMISSFGSARVDESNPFYSQAKDFCYQLSQAGFSVISGGGHGLMRAMNEGAQKGKKGKSIGLNIVLPKEQIPNDFLDHKIKFRFFLVRKLMFVYFAKGFVAFPGGVGTLDELFEVLTLIQTKKIRSFPVILIGKSFWDPLINFINETLIPAQMMTKSEADYIFCTDDLGEAMAYLNEKISRY